MCLCVFQWLFLKLCGTEWTGSNQELTRETDKFFQSKGNSLFFKSVHYNNFDVDCELSDCLFAF